MKWLLVPDWPAEEEGGLGMTQGPAQLRAKAAALKREASAWLVYLFHGNVRTFYAPRLVRFEPPFTTNEDRSFPSVKP